MKAFARDSGLQFRFDPLLNLRIDGGRNPAKLRLSPREVVQLDSDDEERRTELVELWERSGNVTMNSEFLFTCGAGVNSFHIDPYGFLHMCGLVRNPGYDLINGSFRDAWHTFLPGVRDQRGKKDYPCSHCNLHVLCGQCPGWAQLEHGDMEKPVEYLCQVGHLRKELLERENGKRGALSTEIEE